jgi:cation:H+ antiporter
LALTACGWRCQYCPRNGRAATVIGLTVVSIATSAPVVLAGSVAALDGKLEIATGNAAGSNITNTGLVPGLFVLIMPVKIALKTLRQGYLLMFVAAVAAILLMLDYELSRIDSAALLAVLAGFLYWTVRIAKQAPATDPLTGEFEQELVQILPFRPSVLFFILGLILLLAVLNYWCVVLPRLSGPSVSAAWLLV